MRVCWLPALLAVFTPSVEEVADGITAAELFLDIERVLGALLDGIELIGGILHERYHLEYEVDDDCHGDQDKCPEDGNPGVKDLHLPYKLLE